MEDNLPEIDIAQSIALLTDAQLNNQAHDMDLFRSDRIIEMAWEDRTPFEAIFAQFGYKEADVIKLMRASLKRRSFDLWRKRVNSGVSHKHLKKRIADISRFKCALQKTITHNKISKR
jgi:uncharacterized protein (TIGR03643 family)